MGMTKAGDKYAVKALEIIKKTKRIKMGNEVKNFATAISATDLKKKPFKGRNLGCPKIHFYFHFFCSVLKPDNID